MGHAGVALDGVHPYFYLDGTVLKRSWAGEVRNVSLLVAMGVNEREYFLEAARQRCEAADRCFFC